MTTDSRKSRAKTIPAARLRDSATTRMLAGGSGESVSSGEVRDMP